MHISDKDGAAICAVMENNTSLKSLDLSNNDLGEKSCMALKNSLMASASYIRYIRGRGAAAGGKAYALFSTISFVS